MARGLLGRNSNLHIRQRRRDALKEADLVILAGMVPLVVIKKYCNKKMCDFVFMLVFWFCTGSETYSGKNLTGKRL